MTRLFLKIFCWFWGSMILIGLALYFVVLTARPELLPKAWRQTAASSLSIVGGQAVNTWEHQGAQALVSTLALAGQRSQARYWLYSSPDQELSASPGLGPNEMPPAPPFGIGSPPPGEGDGPPDARGGEPPVQDLPGPHFGMDGGPTFQGEGHIRGGGARRFFGGGGPDGHGSPLDHVVHLAFENDAPQFEVMGPDVVVASPISGTPGP